jgi:hypothetical protein
MWRLGFITAIFSVCVGIGKYHHVICRTAIYRDVDFDQGPVP